MHCKQQKGCRKSIFHFADVPRNGVWEAVEMELQDKVEAGDFLPFLFVAGWDSWQYSNHRREGVKAAIPIGELAFHGIQLIFYFYVWMYLETWWVPLKIFPC